MNTHFNTHFDGNATAMKAVYYDDLGVCGPVVGHYSIERGEVSFVSLCFQAVEMWHFLHISYDLQIKSDRIIRKLDIMIHC